MDKFDGKIAIVTGGASGIGRALCEELGRRGALAIVADIDLHAAEQVAASITSRGGRARAAHLDVSQAEAVEALVTGTASDHGRLDLIFNNAGIVIAGDMRDLGLDDWRKVIDVNLMGVLYGSRAAYSLMVEQGFGHIVNVASLAGLIGYPTNLPYAATKFAVVGLFTSLRAEGADLGVKVSVVCPGYVDTNIYEASTIAKLDDVDIRAQIPVKMMEVSEAARVILKGVAKNKAIIVFPLIAQLFALLYRIHPNLLKPVADRVVRDFRALQQGRPAV